MIDAGAIFRLWPDCDGDRYNRVSLQAPPSSMNFINPRTDFAFKKIFGSEQSQPILISFLNALLYDGQPTIEDLVIINPYQAPRIRGVKDSYLDVKAKLSSGETVIIEMQVLNVEGFEKRILYNAAKSYSIQIDKGEEYPALNPVIALTITDFEMFADIPAPISRFVLKEKEYLLDYPINDLELVFVELPKFHQTLEEVENLAEKWLYFLRYAQRFDTIPREIADVPAIEQAFGMANQANLTREELEELEHQAMFIQDQRGAITKAKRQARQEERLAIAQQLLPLLDDAAIAQTTGLAIAAVQSLRQTPR
jgi:predicted transposase/invertase (TIGR01784 family)